MPDPDQEYLTKLNYQAWLNGEPRTPANPYADHSSQESKGWREGTNIPALQLQSTVLKAYKSEAQRETPKEG